MTFNHDSVKVPATDFLRIPMHTEVTIKQVDPDTGLSHQVRIRRPTQQLAQVDLTDWPGHEFELEVNLKDATARMRHPALASAPAADHLTRSVYGHAMRLFLFSEEV